MRCSRCQQENPAGVKFCGGCGTPIQRLAESIQPLPSYADLQRSLTEALEQQTATSEILRVISSSPTDTQPVFDAIAANAARLCSANDAQVLRVDGDVLRLVAAFWSAVDAAGAPTDTRASGGPGGDRPQDKSCPGPRAGRGGVPRDDGHPVRGAVGAGGAALARRSGTWRDQDQPNGGPSVHATSRSRCSRLSPTRR